MISCFNAMSGEVVVALESAALGFEKERIDIFLESPLQLCDLQDEMGKLVKIAAYILRKRSAFDESTLSIERYSWSKGRPAACFEAQFVKSKRASLTDDVIQQRHQNF